MNATSKPAILAFFHAPSFTLTYLASDPSKGSTAIIDPVLDFDTKSGRTGTQFIDHVLATARTAKLSIEWILETHVHADHLTAAPHVKAATGGRTVIGADVTLVQKVFKDAFNIADQPIDGAPFDRLLKDGDTLPLGSLAIEAMATPGHTPACLSYRIGDAVFVGDTMFMPDYGTARTDFPGGDPALLYRSIRRILSLPPDTRLFMCHDYKAPNRNHFAWETTVAEQREKNVHVNDKVDEASFVAMRKARDATLAMPALILPSVQVNMRAGIFPTPEANGVSYLKLPLNRF